MSDARASGVAWTVARGAHLVVALVAAGSLVLDLVMIIARPEVATGQDRLSVATRIGHELSYFTVQSNIVVLVAAAGLAADPVRDGRIWRILRLDGLLGIIITGIVYAVLLAPVTHLTGLHGLANIGLHRLTPILTVLVWLAFGPRPRIGWSTIGWALLWPVAWAAYTFIHGSISGWFPYDFLDPDTLGWPAALRTTGLLLAFAVILELVLKLLDRLPSAVASRQTRVA
jgi:hypothetical protein